MLTKEAIQELAKSSATLAANEAIGGCADDNGLRGIAALPNDFQIHDLENDLPLRRRPRGTMTTSVVDDFAAYFDAHQESGASVFIDQSAMRAVAVLNLGDPAEPGHADNTAVLAPKMTAAYTALQQIATGQGRSQQAVAEFLEDWAPQIECFNEAAKISNAQAIAAVRKITIEGMRKVESQEKQLGAAKSTFEQVQASSGTDPLPTHIYFKTVPFHCLSERTFVLRLGVLTTDKPAVTLRIVNAEQHAEDMATELAQLVRGALPEAATLVGTYAAKT